MYHLTKAGQELVVVSDEDGIKRGDCCIDISEANIELRNSTVDMSIISRDAGTNGEAFHRNIKKVIASSIPHENLLTLDPNQEVPFRKKSFSEEDIQDLFVRYGEVYHAGRNQFWGGEDYVSLSELLSRQTLPLSTAYDQLCGEVDVEKLARNYFIDLAKNESRPIEYYEWDSNKWIKELWIRGFNEAKQSGFSLAQMEKAITFGFNHHKTCQMVHPEDYNDVPKGDKLQFIQSLLPSRLIPVEIKIEDGKCIVTKIG